MQAPPFGSILMPARPLGEETPLNSAKGGAAEGDRGGANDFTTSKIAAPIAFVIYGLVVLTKTLTTKALMVSGMPPVALSAWSSFVTCLCCVPAFVIDQEQWGVPSRENYPGLALVVVLLSLDMGLNNCAVSMLTVPVQQCLLAVNPTFTVCIESAVRRTLKHPIIYLMVILICVGPFLTSSTATSHHSSHEENSNQTGLGIFVQLLGVLASACKGVFTHSVMRDCKKDLGSSVSFLFWLDVLSLVILVPWATIPSSNEKLYGGMYTLMAMQHTAVDWMKLVRFSRVPTPAR